MMAENATDGKPENLLGAAPSNRLPEPHTPFHRCQA